MKALPETLLTFYGPKSLQIHIVPTEEADEFYQLCGLSHSSNTKPACDVAIVGLGWISVALVSQLLRTSDSSEVETDEEVSLLVHVPNPVEIFVRPPLPVGKTGGECYQYRELMEK
ncbi:NO-associated protein 1 [Abeliophyllum distichum]|uniref:NO-associated protein 1 n=1 Tax=Abeliophyllum distichum TaxID=126358 RepID=A0ABD1VRP2_9LAMI